MISHHQKCVFVHIPKNAGQSIEHVFINLLELTWETRAPLLLRRNEHPELGPLRLAHLKAEEYVKYKYMTQEQYEEYFKFAIVRNPWDRLVSFYKYLGYKNQMDFKTFVTEEFKNKVFKERYWFVGPQYEYVVDKNGKMIVDFIGKFESLQEDFDRACPLMALPATNVPHVNKSSERNKKPQSTFGALKETFKTGTGKSFPSFKRYQDYYDDESSQVVIDLYGKDIEMFEYELS
ncbi:sulfotransferase family 2 domain-containing protein [uncultured Paraglaciecola sp.]|uniref:sulfotransferase family 2 domain-containing protein n=1 Tax=uncultured Paraglaciecola sp. TaxID=1765024 RepID=UPI00260C2309|nr:sulfotransferase family 2 domain-containing protein [uncultured Paraglaciecola sp.]